MIQQEYKNNVQDVSGEVQATGFSVEVNASVFRMLTSDVYNNPTLAVIREWSTNACDACVAAGVEPKFEVHIPTLSEPWFSVRDYGTGLPPEDIEGIFSVLGASTKRDSNKYNGTLGIGRMAGLAVADAFTVESYYQGTKYAYAISMQNGEPVTLSMGTLSTDDPNGLRMQVAVPVEDIPTYRENAEYLYKYFDHKPTLNVESLDIHLPIQDQLSEGWFIQEPRQAYDYSNYVVMSQVPYVIPTEGTVDDRGFRNLVIKAKPGQVTFNPGRESLSLNKATVAFLNDAFEQIEEEYLAAANAAMAAATNDAELMEVYRTTSGKAPHDVSKKIDPIPYTSDLFKKLFTAYHNSIVVTGNNSVVRSYHYLGATASFENDTWGTLGLYYKPRYYPKSKAVVSGNWISWSEFFGTEHIVVDMKTGFRGALNDQYSGEPLVTWVRQPGMQLEDAVDHAKRYLDTLGIPYKLASEVLPKKEKGPKKERKGVYASKVLEYGTVPKSQSMTADEVDNGQYLYLKLSNTTPVLDERDSNLDYTQYIAAYRMLKKAGVPMPEIRGVSKKYQAYVDSLDNWLDFQTYIEDKMATAEFCKPLDKAFHLPAGDVINDATISGFPEDIQMLYKDLHRYVGYKKAPSFVSQEDADTAEEFNATVNEFEWSEGVDIDALEAKYERSFPYLLGRDSWRVYMPGNHFIRYLTNLEHHYATYPPDG